MKISVIILTYERLGELKECLHGIFMQKQSDYEIIIVDESEDLLTEQYIGELKKSNIVYIHKNTKGNIGENRRSAFLRASGDIVVFIDDDDYLTDDHYFKTLIDIFKKEKDVDLVMSDTSLFYEVNRKKEKFSLNIPERIMAKEYFKGFGFKYKKPTSTLGFAARMDVLKNAGFDQLHMMNDTIIYLKALAASKNVYHINKPIGCYRIHGSNYSKKVDYNLILEHLAAKKSIYDESRNILSFPRKTWLYRQIIITTAYYLRGANGDKKGIRAVLRFIRREIGFLCYLYLSIMRWRINK